MNETAGKIQIDLAASAWLGGDPQRAADIITKLVTGTIVEGRLAEHLHRADLEAMAADCLFKAVKRITEENGGEFLIAVDGLRSKQYEEVHDTLARFGLNCRRIQPGELE